jgi:LPS O-antigen subunit length determinant protein (WzzB/FepE family)
MRTSKLTPYLAERIIFSVIVVGALATIAVLIYRYPKPDDQNSREFIGKIVDKRVSVYESDKGSSFLNDLIIEEKSGRRFLLSVTDEMYSRASIGMWIKRSKYRLDLFTDAEWRERSP